MMHTIVVAAYSMNNYDLLPSRMRCTGPCAIHWVKDSTSAAQWILDTVG